MSRFTEPFTRPPGLSVEQNQKINLQNEAIRLFRETGDDSLAIEVGLFPKQEDMPRSRDYKPKRGI